MLASDFWTEAMVLSRATRGDCGGHWMADRELARGRSSSFPQFLFESGRDYSSRQRMGFVVSRSCYRHTLLSDGEWNRFRTRFREDGA